MAHTEGDRLGQALSKAKMSREELAVLLHVGGKTIERWINDKYPIPLKYMAEIERYTGSSGMWIKTGMWRRDDEAAVDDDAPALQPEAPPPAMPASSLPFEERGRGMWPPGQTEIPLSVPFKIGDQTAFFLDLNIRFSVRPAHHAGIDISIHPLAQGTSDESQQADGNG